MRLDTAKRHTAIATRCTAIATRCTAAATVILLLLAGCVKDRDEALDTPTGQAENTQTAEDAARQDTSAEAATLYAAMEQDERLTMMTNLVDRLGLNILLAEEGVDYTVFAPSDEAFGTLEQVTLTTLTEPDNAGLLRDIVTAHLVQGVYTPEELREQEGLLAAGGETTLSIDATDDSLLVDGAQIIASNPDVGNGALYIINSVVLPHDPSLHQERTPATVIPGE